MSAISEREWRWVISWAAVIMLMSSIPYFYGGWLSTPQMQFSGFFIGVEDANSYLAKMRQGAEGDWLFHLPYTPEAHPGVYLYMFHLMLGKIGLLTGLSPIFTYHLARLILGVLLLILIYLFIATFTANLKIRKTAFLLASLGGGLGWLVIATGWVKQIGLPLDIYLPEGFNFLILLHLPHLLMAEILLITGFLLLLQGWHVERNGWQWAVLAGAAFFVALGIAAFYLAIISAVLGVTLGLRFWVTRRWLWSEIWLTALALAVTLPVVLYNIWVFATIPAYQVLGEQLVMRSPAPLHYLLAYGLLVLLALPGLKVCWQKGDRYSLFLMAWVMVVPILVYLPFNLQRRLVMGVQLPLAILAALGLSQLCGTKVKRWFWSSLGLVLFSSLTPIFLLIGSLSAISAQQPPIFHSTPQLEAMRWLNQTTNNGEVILAVYETGNILPAYAHVRAFVGHGPETIHSDEKQEQARLFFSRTTSEAWRRDLLKKFKVSYVYYGPNEKAAGDFKPEQSPYLKQVYKNSDIQIFQVNFKE